MTDPMNTASQPAATAEDVKHNVTEHATEVKERAGDAIDAGRRGAAEVGGQAVDAAREVAAEASRQARDLVGEARSEVSQRATDQHRKLVDGLRQLSDELGSMTNSSDQSGIASELASQAGERVNQMAEWLSDKQPGDVLQEVRRFARNRPGAFLIGAAIAGVVAGRVTRGAVESHTNSDGAQTGQTGQTGSAEDADIASAQTSVLPAATTFPEPAAAGAGYQPTGSYGGPA